MAPTVEALTASLRRAAATGAAVVGAGLLVSGLGAYVFLLLAAHALGPHGYAALSSLWALSFLLAFSLFVPLQQEVTRAVAARRSVGIGGAPVVVRAALLGMVAGTVVVVALLGPGAGLLDRLLDGDPGLEGGLILAMAGYWGVYIAYGSLAAERRFPAYAALLAGEGLVRLAGAAALVAAGRHDAGAYGLVFGAAPLVAAAALVAVRPPRPGRGPGHAWRELTTALGTLLAASVLSQALLNGPPLAVKALSTGADEERVGTFLAGVVATRIPLFLFTAVQAAILPRLSAAAARGDRRAMTRTLATALQLVAAVVAVTVAVCLLAGPALMRLAFGSRFELGRTDLAALALASGGYMAALTTSQALIALERRRATVAGWGAGVVVFAILLAVPLDVVGRVELAFVTATLAAAASMGLWLRAGARLEETP